MEKHVLTAADIETLAANGEITLLPGTIVTDRAREVAEARGVTIRFDASVAGGDVALPGPAAAAPQSTLKRVVAIGADHGGFELKELLKRHLEDWGYKVRDCGTDSATAVDYPDFALAVAQAVARGQAWRGIAVDSVGIGSAIAANKVRGIRAALCYDRATARSSREHNNANVLTLGARMLRPEEAREILRVWLDAEFAGGRHQARLDKIAVIESEKMKVDNQ